MDQPFIEAPKPGAMSSADKAQAIDSSQLPECAPTRTQAEMGEHMGRFQTEGKHKTPAEPSDITMEPPQGLASLPRPQQPSLTDDEFPAQTQQTRLFDDPRRHKLFDEYNEVIRQNPDSHLARLGELAHYVFDNGRPARVWTSGGVGSAQVGLDPSTISIHGRCSCTYDDADILLLTESEHAAWSRANNPPKLVVIRDPRFSERRPGKSTESWLREQEKRTHKTWVDVQRLNRQCNDGAAENIPLRDAIQQWRISQDSNAISLETPPMNLLNISDKTMGHWPEGLAKDYQLLFEAIDDCEGMIYRSLDERLLPLEEQDHGIGKTTLMLFSHSDIQKCTQFRILAHRGACSSWHIDNAGVYTFIILEGNIDSPDEQAEDVVKYWPVYPTHHMSAEDEHRARVEFSQEGITWRPTPNGNIPVIALTRGDMLIQPPGTIHAPITLTNCFFLGGMAWRKSTLPQTLNVWHYLMKNEICTNEPLPRQSQAILNFIKAAVHDAPEEHGYRESELGEFDRICDEISGMVSKCGCSKACSLSTKCSCLMQGLKCGIRCHKGSTLHHTTCTTVNMLSPSSLSGRGKRTKRSRLKDDEDSDYTSNGTPVAKIKRKKRAVEASQPKAPNATLDAITLQPPEYLNNSPAVADSNRTSSGTPSPKAKRKRAVEAPQVKTLDVKALLPDERPNNSLAVADSTELKRPETCPGPSTDGACEYTEGRGGRLACKYCSTALDFDGEAIRHTRPRSHMKADVVNEIDSTRSPNTEEVVSQRRNCDNCPRSIITVDRGGPNCPNTLCGACKNKRAKARRENKANNEADEAEVPIGMSTLDEAKTAAAIALSARRETPLKSGGSETSRAPEKQSRPSKEDYCVPCQAIVVHYKWYNYEDASVKGRRCGKCYQIGYGKALKERRKSLGGELVLPSPARENEATVPSGIKIRLSPIRSSAAKESNADTMVKSASQQDPPLQLQSCILPSSFDAPPGLSQEDGAIRALKTDLPIATTELQGAADPQFAEQELAMAYPPQHADLQSFVSREATPELSIEHKPEANGVMIPKLEPQALPTLAQENAEASPLKPNNLNTEPEAVAELTATNGSTTTEPTPEHSNFNSHFSSPLTEPVDGFSDPDDVDLFIVS